MACPLGLARLLLLEGHLGREMLFPLNTLLLLAALAVAMAMKLAIQLTVSLFMALAAALADTELQVVLL
jgi:hypothetical protein